MRMTSRLHDENEKLLEQQASWDRVRRENEAVRTAMREFKTEYSAKIDKVRGACCVRRLVDAFIPRPPWVHGFVD